jgi:hypothetical protein
MTRSFMEQAVIMSPESAQRQVEGFYSAFFHRLPDSAAALWVEQLVAGVPASQVEAEILTDANAEFYLDGEATVQRPTQ